MAINPTHNKQVTPSMLCYIARNLVITKITNVQHKQFINQLTIHHSLSEVHHKFPKGQNSDLLRCHTQSDQENSLEAAHWEAAPTYNVHCHK